MIEAVVLATSAVPPWLVDIARQIEHALAPARRVIKPILASWWTLSIWATLNVVSLGVLWWDLRERNQNLASLMKLVWTLVVAYPVNVLLIGIGVKEEIGNPAEMDASGGS